MVNANTMIRYLLDEQIGEQMRLEEMLQRCQGGKKLYNSDLAYINNLYPQDNEEPVTFSEETFIFDDIPKVIKNNHVRTVLLMITGIILIAVAVFVFLLVFTNLLFFHGSPIEGFCDDNPIESCVAMPYTHQFLQEQLSKIYDGIIVLFNDKV